MDGYGRMYQVLRQTAREEGGSSLRFTLTVNVTSGDSVLLLTEDDQTFYLIGRVVGG